MRITTPNIALETQVELFSAFHPEVVTPEEFAATLADLTKPAAAESAGSTSHSSLHSFLQAKTHIPTLDDLNAMNRIAADLQRQGHLDKAEAVLRRLIKTLQLAPSAMQEHLYKVQTNLATLLGQKGELVEAKRLLMQTLQAQRRTMGHEHLDTISTMEHLAGLLFGTDKSDDAAPLMREVVVLRRRLLGDGHPDTLRAFNNLALLLQGQGKYADAKGLLMQTYISQEQLLGAEHDDTLTTLSNLGRVHDLLGEFEAAEKALQLVFSLRQRQHGLAELETLSAGNHLSAFLVARGRFEEAADCTRSLLRAAEAYLSPNNPLMALLQARLGRCLMAQEQFALAEPLLLMGYKGLQQTFGEMNSRTQEVLQHIIAVYQAWGKTTEVAKYRALVARIS